MTIDDGAIEAVLKDAWPDAHLEGSTPLTAGQWATMAHLRLTGTPHRVPHDLVLRVAPDPQMGAKELAVQAAMHDAGIPTPRIQLTGAPGGPLTDAWALMDFAPGDSLISGLDGAAALRRLPQLLRRLPAQLADTMTAIHQIDPQPVVERVRQAAPTAAVTIDELWPHLHAGAETAQRPDLHDALDQLADTQPDQSAAVVCHGDLHPFNLLEDPNGSITVLDWTGALVAPAAFDVALTRTFLRHPPLVMPPALRPAINAGAAVLARRFLRRYQHLNPTTDLDDLGWYSALHAARILIDLAVWQHTDDPRTRTHPWHLIAPAATQTLEATLTPR